MNEARKDELIDDISKASRTAINFFRKAGFGMYQLEKHYSPKKCYSSTMIHIIDSMWDGVARHIEDAIYEYRTAETAVNEKCKMRRPNPGAVPALKARYAERFDLLRQKAGGYPMRDDVKTGVLRYVDECSTDVTFYLNCAGEGIQQMIDREFADEALGDMREGVARHIKKALFWYRRAVHIVDNFTSENPVELPGFKS